MRIKATTVGAGRTAQRFRRAARGVRDDVANEVERVTDEGRKVLVARGSGRISDPAGNIVAVKSLGGPRPTGLVSADPHSEEGFPYLSVSRFGRREVRPKQAKVLRFYWKQAGHVVFLPFVRAWKPRTDWVADAGPAIRVAGARGAKRLQGRVRARLSA